jgi:hypothetical protein
MFTRRNHYVIIIDILGGYGMNIVRFFPGDTIELKKTHPCGSKLFRVVRVGSDVRIICSGCGRDMTVDRVKLEKSIKKVIAKEKENNVSL